MFVLTIVFVFVISIISWLVFSFTFFALAVRAAQKYPDYPNVVLFPDSQADRETFGLFRAALFAKYDFDKVPMLVIIQNIYRVFAVLYAVEIIAFMVWATI